MCVCDASVCVCCVRVRMRMRMRCAWWAAVENSAGGYSTIGVQGGCEFEVDERTCRVEEG